MCANDVMWRSGAVVTQNIKVKIEMMSLSRDFRSKLVSIDRLARDLFGPRLQSHNSQTNYLFIFTVKFRNIWIDEIICLYFIIYK